MENDDWFGMLSIRSEEACPISGWKSVKIMQSWMHLMSSLSRLSRRSHLVALPPPPSLLSPQTPLATQDTDQSTGLHSFTGKQSSPLNSARSLGPLPSTAIRKPLQILKRQTNPSGCESCCIARHQAQPLEALQLTNPIPSWSLGSSTPWDEVEALSRLGHAILMALYCNILNFFNLPASHDAGSAPIPERRSIAYPRLCLDLRRLGNIFHSCVEKSRERGHRRKGTWIFFQNRNNRVALSW